MGFSKDYLRKKKDKKRLEKIVKIENPDPRVRRKLIDQLYEGMKKSEKEEKGDKS